MTDPRPNACTLDEVRVKLRILWARNPHTPIMLWGASGLGKSALIHSFANDPTEHVRAMLRDGEIPGMFVLRGHALDHAALNGVLVDRGDYADWLPLRRLPHPEQGDPASGFVFLDEINCTLPSIQPQLMQLVYDRCTANYRLPDGYHIVGAGNPAESRGATHQMLSPLKRRFVNIIVRADLDEWITWATLHQIDPRIIGFLRWRPELLIVDPMRGEDSEACPRTWEYASRVLTSPISCPADLQLSLLTDCVGPGPAGELYGYLAIMDELPDPDDILHGKPVPAPSGRNAPAVTYALIAALVSRVVTPPTKPNNKRYTPTEVCELILRWCACLEEEYQVCLIKDVIHLGKECKEYDNTLVRAPTWPRWASAHKDVILPTETSA